MPELQQLHTPHLQKQSRASAVSLPMYFLEHPAPETARDPRCQLKSPPLRLPLSGTLGKCLYIKKQTKFNLFMNLKCHSESNHTNSGETHALKTLFKSHTTQHMSASLLLSGLETQKSEEERTLLIPCPSAANL